MFHEYHINLEPYSLVIHVNFHFIENEKKFYKWISPYT